MDDESGTYLCSFKDLVHYQSRVAIQADLTFCRGICTKTVQLMDSWNGIKE